MIEAVGDNDGGRHMFTIRDSFRFADECGSGSSGSEESEESEESDSEESSSEDEVRCWGVIGCRPAVPLGAAASRSGACGP